MNGELSEDRGWVDHLGTGFSGLFCIEKKPLNPVPKWSVLCYNIPD